MKKSLSALAAIMLTAAAAVNAGESPLYVSGKIGLMDPDVPGFDRATNLGVTVGYVVDNNPSIGIFSVEGEFTTTISDGKIDGGGEWDADTFGIFGAYRSLGDVYFIGKVGYVNQDIKRAGGTTGTIPNADDSGLAYGVGVGWRIDRVSSIEFEATAESDELNFFSVGYVRRF